MTTIEIVQELDEPNMPLYRAMYGRQQAHGTTPGEALDSLERVLAASDVGNSSGLRIIVQRFGPDDFFSAAQQGRLRALMDRFHAAQAQGTTLSPNEQAELEQLVEEEWEAAIARSETILPEDPVQ